jgi:Helix-turn-helix domain
MAAWRVSGTGTSIGEMVWRSSNQARSTGGREDLLSHVLTGPVSFPDGPLASRSWITAETSGTSWSPAGSASAPEQVGLHSYGGKRRVPGLRREEVAMLAGLSVDYYGRLERGNLAGASESVLEAVARALQLDAAERQHLLDLARSTSTSTARRPPRPPGLPHRMLQRTIPRPCAVPGAARLTTRARSVCSVLFT